MRRGGEGAPPAPARFVVDAGGRATRLGRQLDLRREHGKLAQMALHSWFEGVDRGQHRRASWTHDYFLPEVRGWAWRAPIDADITSVGVVASRARYQDAGQEPEEFFVRSLEGNRKLARVTRRARRVDDMKGDVNYSYRLERVCGDGWLALGDAARFIDPVFSSGVTVAMHSARGAAAVAREALRNRDVSREALLPYESDVLAQGAIWDDFTRLFYRLLPGFTQLLDSKEHRPALARLIQGDVLDRGTPASSTRSARWCAAWRRPTPTRGGIGWPTSAADASLPKDFNRSAGRRMVGS